MLGGSPGQLEEEREHHIGAIATIISPTDPARDLTAGPLPDYTASAFIDTGATHNIISRLAVEKAGLKSIKRLSLAVSLINGAELPIAGVYRKTLRITDGNKETRLQAVTLPCMNLHGFNIVLRMSWTTTARPLFHWEQREWTYGSDDDWPKARILAPQAFYASMQKLGARMYAVSMAPNPDHPHVAAASVRAG